MNLATRTEGEYIIEEKRWIDRDRHRINKKTLVTRNGNLEGKLGESVKLYSETEFVRMLRACDLVVESTFGDTTGAPMGPDQPRMIVVGRKNGA